MMGEGGFACILPARQGSQIGSGFDLLDQVIARDHLRGM